MGWSQPPPPFFSVQCSTSPGFGTITEMRLALAEWADCPFTLIDQGKDSAVPQSGMHWPSDVLRLSPPERTHSITRSRTGATTGIWAVSQVTLLAVVPGTYQPVAPKSTDLSGSEA